MMLIKVLLVAILTTFTVVAQVPFELETEHFNGQDYARVNNYTSNNLHCYIGYSEFYVEPYKPSRWYPYDEMWDCKYL